MDLDDMIEYDGGNDENNEDSYTYEFLSNESFDQSQLQLPIPPPKKKPKLRQSTSSGTPAPINFERIKLMNEQESK